EMQSALGSLAVALTGGRFVFGHEGGVSEWYPPMLVLGTASALAGLPAPQDPFLHALDHLPGQRMQRHPARVIEHLEARHPLLAGRPAATGTGRGGADA
ncbi:class II histone deacetylase, partial [Streptomyces prasinus]